MNEMLFTKECEVCGYVFSRFIEHLNAGLGKDNRKEQQVCPTCQKPVFVVKVEHPGETL